MAMAKEIYPIGIQTFSVIREDNYKYVDKTSLVYDLVSNGKYYFLSRPRRFGKSLLLSTIEALYLGKRELFKGLAIDSLSWDWTVHPVFHIDMNGKVYDSTNDFDDRLAEQLRVWEEEYGYSLEGTSVDERFRTLVRKAFETTGKKVVILIDEYDQPLLHNIERSKRDLQDQIRAKMQATYSILKSYDRYICFAMLTGVTKFSKVSVFSGLNNLNDISLDPRYNALCGISETELCEQFHNGVADFAAAQGMSEEEIYAKLKTDYDGYHFARSGEGIYNPFSLLKAFDKKDFGSYWFESGNPRFLNTIIKERDWDLSDINDITRSEQSLSGYDIYLSDPIPLLFQSGYLTIKGFDPKFREYRLGFPNEEVAQGFAEGFLKCISSEEDPMSFIKDFTKDVENGDADAFMDRLQSFLADFPYDQIRDLELHWQNVMYLIMKLMGFYVQTEYKTSDGRIDMVVKTNRFIYVIEFKLKSTSKAAMQQIKDKEYALPFLTDGREVILIGAAFSPKTRRLKKWLIEKVKPE